MRTRRVPHPAPTLTPNRLGAAPKRVNLAASGASKPLSWRQLRRAGQHAHESHRDFASQSGGRAGGHPHGRAARHLRADQTTDPAVPEHRRAGDLDLHQLARGGAHRDRIRNHRAAGAGARGPARHAVAQRLRERRQRVPQPAVRGRHRHAGDDARSHQPHEPAAAAAARCAGAADLAGRGRRQRPQQHAVVVLRAAAARHAGPHRQLPPPDRRAVPQPHRVDSRRLQRAHQLRLRRRAADRVRPGARRGARHPDPAHRAGGGQRRRRLRRLRRHRPPPVHRCASRAAIRWTSSRSWCSSGATAARCGSATSPPSR